MTAGTATTVEHIARGAQDLPPEKQVEVLEFVEFLRQRHGMAVRLERLVERWQRECLVFSSTERWRNHAAYREIVALGETAVPLILRRIEAKPTWLVWALADITHENPVPVAAAGDMEQTVAAWLAWGRTRGLVP